MITKEQASAIAEAGHEMVRRRGAHVMRWERGNPEALSIPAWDAIGPSKQEEYAAAIFRYNATGEIEWIPDPLKSGASVHIAQAPEARWPLDSFKVGADQKIIELGLTAEFPQRTATTDGATAALAITELAAVVESYALAAGCDCGSGASPLSRIRSSVALMAARILEVAPPSSPDGRMVSLGQRAWREFVGTDQRGMMESPWWDVDVGHAAAWALKNDGPWPRTTSHRIGTDFWSAFSWPKFRDIVRALAASDPAQLST